MAFSRPEDRVVEAEGFVTGSDYGDVDDVYRNISRVIEEFSAYDVEEAMPSYTYDRKVYKVTIKVELV